MRARLIVGAAVALLVGVAGLMLVVVVRSADGGDKADGTVSRASAGAPATVVSTNAQGVQGNGYSNAPAVSRDGTLVAFTSSASNLHPADTGDEPDIYVKNLVTGAVTLVSVSVRGVAGNGASTGPAISADGRYVTFMSDATDLVANDTNNVYDVFRRDLVTGVTELVSVAAGGAQADAGSADASVSADGRYVAFASNAGNLGTGPRSDQDLREVYVRDMVSRETVWVSAPLPGSPPGRSASTQPSISADGRYVAYTSQSEDLVVPDTNQLSPDVYRWDRTTRRTLRVGVTAAGAQFGGSQYPAISGDGRYVAFFAGSGPQIYVRDVTLGTTELVSGSADVQGDGASFGPSVSADGRFVAFDSRAANLVADDRNDKRDIFVRDRVARTTVRVNLTGDRGEANDASNMGAITPDGTRVVFSSDATNLLAPDTNGKEMDVLLAPVR
jgi:Tol biopolymer transport system component